MKPMDEYTTRLSKINDLAIASRDLLYNYNKEKLNSFMDSIENLIIVETFLFMQGLFGDPSGDEALMAKKEQPAPIIEKKPLLPYEPSFVDELKKRELKYAGKNPRNDHESSEEEPVQAPVVKKPKRQNLNNDQTDEYLRQKLADDFKDFSFSFWKICK